MTVIEGNKLIAEFMGAEMPSYSTKPNGDIDKCSLVYNGHRVDYIYVMDKWSEYGDLFRFRSSWDWLMPVVEKIKTIYATLDLELSMMVQNKFIILDLTIFADITTTWGAAIQFIQWHNSTLTNKN